MMMIPSCILIEYINSLMNEQTSMDGCTKQI